MNNIPLYKTRPINDLKDMLEQSEKLYGSKNAFIIKDKDNTYRGINFTSFKRDVDALGTAFISIGLKNSHIAIMSENRYEWCLTYLSTVNGTGVVVPLDKELPLEEIENLLTRSGAKAIVFSKKHCKDMEIVKTHISSVEYYICMDSEADDENFLSLSRLIAKGKLLLDEGDRSFVDAKIDDEAMNMLLFTSGTTDLAKGVMLSHKNICSDLISVCSMLYIDSTDSALSILPLHHTYECTCNFLVMVYNGCTIAFNEGLKHIPKNLKEVQPSILMLVPLILESMYKKIWEQASKKKLTKIKLKAALCISNLLYNKFNIDVRRRLFKQIHENIGGRVRLIISGAAGINPDVAKGFMDFGITLLQGYGLTECSPIVSVNTEKKFNHQSIGLPLYGVRVRIDNPNHEGIGEIAVKGNNVMLGYFNNEQATRKVMHNGWFSTGDLGYMDESGFLFITGRKKNVIVTKNGKNIFPEEVEAYLNKSPFIMESMVYGKYDENTGETHVNAQIVPDYDAIKQKLKLDTVTDDEVYKLIKNEVKNSNRSMPLYKKVESFTIRRDEFAKTTTKKIKRYMEKTG